MTECIESIACGNAGYQSPEVEVLEVVVERGYAASGEDNEQLPAWKPTYW